jgi:general secretion pathway protein C
LKHRSVLGLIVAALMVFFWGTVPFDAPIPQAQAQQGLGFKLVGTAVIENPGESFAIIEHQSTGNQGAYREGDRLGEVVIKKILSGSVVIATRAGDQTLYMGSGVASAGSTRSSGEIAHLDRREVESTLPDYEQLMREIRVRRRFEGGQPIGFVIYKIEPGSIFERMGLRDGDLIVGVNGRPFATTQQNVEFYEALKSGGAVSLEIMRGESKLNLDFVIQ